MRILHFCCAYLHTSILPRIADLGGALPGCPPQAYAYDRASSSGTKFTWLMVGQEMVHMSSGKLCSSELLECFLGE